MPTWKGISYTEIRGGATVNVTRDDHSRVRVLRCAETDLDAFIEAILGYTFLDGEAQYRVIDPMPFQTGSPLFASAVATQQKGTMAWSDTLNRVVAEEAELTVTFTFQHNEDDDESQSPDERVWVEVASTNQLEFIRLERHGVQWEATGGGKDTPTDIAFVTGTLVVTAQSLIVSSAIHFRSKLGKINDASWKGYPAGTLMLAGHSPRLSLSSTGTVISRGATLQMNFRSEPWDYAPAAQGGWAEIRHAAGVPVAERISFKALGKSS